MKEKGHLIQAVEEGGIAEEMGIEPGDRLLEINGETVEDIFDYQYMIEEEYVEVLIAKPSGEEWLLEIDKDYEEDEEVKIIRTKKFGIKPMYPEDACVQMELLGHNFFVFFNAETEQVNVVYKRKGNTYGLIEPEF